MTDVRYLSSLQQHMPNIYNYSMSQKKVISPILSLLTQVFSGHPVEFGANFGQIYCSKTLVQFLLYFGLYDTLY